MIHSSWPSEAPSLSWMVVRAVVTTRMSSPTMSDATEVRASTQRGLGSAAPPRSGPGSGPGALHWYVPASPGKFIGPALTSFGSGRAAAEVPGVHLDGGVPFRGQPGPGLVGVRGAEQGGRAQPGGAVVGEQRSVSDQLAGVLVRPGVQVGGGAGAETEDQEAAAGLGVTGVIPHGAAEPVLP